MITIKAGSEAANLKGFAKLLGESNKTASAAKKQADIAKENISLWLLNQREISISHLEIGETVAFADCDFLIRIDKQNRFDETAFAAAYPALYIQFKRDKPVVKFLV